MKNEVNNIISQKCEFYSDDESVERVNNFKRRKRNVIEFPVCLNKKNIKNSSGTGTISVDDIEDFGKYR